MSVRSLDITHPFPPAVANPKPRTYSSPDAHPWPAPAPNTRVPTQRREPHVYGCDTAPGSNAYSKFSRGRRARATESLVLRPDYSTKRGARVRKFGYFISRALTVPLSLSLSLFWYLSRSVPLSVSLEPSPSRSRSPSLFLSFTLFALRLLRRVPVCLLSGALHRPALPARPRRAGRPRITCVLYLFDVARYAF